MAPTPIQQPGWAVSRDVSDADELAHALDGGSMEYLPLQEGRYSARLTLLGAGQVVMQRVVDPPHLARGVVDAERVAILTPITIATPARVNGVPMDAGEALLLRPGAEFHGLSVSSSDWVSLSVPAALADELLDLAGLRACGPAAAPLRLPPTLVFPLQAELVRITDGFRDGIGVEAAALLGGTVYELLAASFARAEPVPAPARAERSALRLVDDVEAYMRGNISRPVYLDELGRAVGASPRRLHIAFLATTGMNPSTWLRRWRMMQAHRALKEAGPERDLVKRIALGCGFLHLGRFAQYHAAMFGSLPHETLGERWRR